MKIHWMPQALRDLSGIRRYIARDNPDAARRWIRQLQARAKVASCAPLAGRVVPEVNKADVREVFLRSYRIVYRVVGDEFHILTVFEGHRLFPMDTVQSEKDPP